MANFAANLKPLIYLEENSVPCHEVKLQEETISFFMYGETTEFRVRTLLQKNQKQSNGLNLLLGAMFFGILVQTLVSTLFMRQQWV